MATDADPYTLAQRQIETVHEADRFRGLLPSIELGGARFVYRRVMDGTFEATIVLLGAGTETVRSEPFAELFLEKLETGGLKVYAYDAEVPVYLGLADEDLVEIGWGN